MLIAHTAMHTSEITCIRTVSLLHISRQRIHATANVLIGDVHHGQFVLAFNFGRTFQHKFITTYQKISKSISVHLRVELSVNKTIELTAAFIIIIIYLPMSIIHEKKQ